MHRLNAKHVDVNQSTTISTLLIGTRTNTALDEPFTMHAKTHLTCSLGQSMRTSQHKTTTYVVNNHKARLMLSARVFMLLLHFLWVSRQGTHMTRTTLQ